MGEREERLRELRETLFSLDQAHDALGREADNKDETIQQLEQQLNEKVSSMQQKIVFLSLPLPLPDLTKVASLTSISFVNLSLSRRVCVQG